MSRANSPKMPRTAPAWAARYRSATAECAVLQDIGLVVLEGRITQQAWPEILGDFGRWMAAQTLTGLAVDCSLATFDMDIDTLIRLEKDACDEDKRLEAPIALVVAEHQVEMFRDHMLQMGHFGCCRAPFRLKPQALRWAREQAFIYRDFAKVDGLRVAHSDTAFQAMLSRLVDARRPGKRGRAGLPGGAP